MEMAAVVAKKSKDPRTKVGAIITNDINEVIGVGFNGPPRYIDDKIICWEAPEKYNWILHAEENAILFGMKHGKDKATTLYTTAFPCVHCTLIAIQVSITRIVYGTCMPVMCLDNQLKVMEIAKEAKIDILRF